MSTKRSRMAFVAATVGRAVVTGLALYGAKRLYDDYMNSSTDPNPKQPRESEDCTKVPESESEPSDGFEVSLRDLMKDYHMEVVIPNSCAYQQQLNVLAQVLETVHMLLRKACPNLRIGNFEPKVHESLSTVGSGQSYTVHLPLQLDQDVWQCTSGADTLVPGADGFFLIKRINQEFFRLGTDPYDKYLIGSHLSSGKLFSFLREQCLILDLDRNLNYKLSACPKQTIEFVIEYNDDWFQFRLVPTITLNRTTVLAEFSDDNLWRKCTYDTEDSFLNTINDSELECLQCLLNCATRDEFLSKFDENVFLNIFITTSNSQDVEMAERFWKLLQTLQGALESDFLPHFCNPFVNVLRPYSKRLTVQTCQYLTNLLQNDDVHKLFRFADSCGSDEIE